MSERTESVDSPDVSVTVEIITDSRALTGSVDSPNRRDRREPVPKGWQQVSSAPVRFVGRYKADGVRMSGGAERTSSGRYRFYVKSPTETFWENANQLLYPDRGLVDGAYRIDFPKGELPATLAEGIEAVQRLMVADDREREATGEDDSDPEEWWT